MLIVVDKSTLEESLSQPLQSIDKQFKIAVTILTGYNGIFNVTNKNICFYFARLLNVDNFCKKTFHQEPMKQSVQTMKLNEIFLKKGYLNI